MSADQTATGRRQVFADLVAGLLDARDDPASDRFDAELEAALTNGTITAETAHRLRFWQRASVRTLADHTRTVLPAALGALEAARREARQDVADMASTLGPDPQTRDRPRSAPTEAESDPEPKPETDAEADFEADTRARPGAPQPPPGPTGWGDTPGGASSTPAVGPSSLEQRRNRLIVADLVPARSDIRTNRR